PARRDRTVRRRGAVRTLARLAIGIVAVAVVAGCGGREQSVRRATASSVPPVPAGARPCHALRYKGTQGANSVTDVYWLAVKNTSSKTCALDGRPAIVVLPGAPAPLSVIAPPLDPSAPS